MLERPDALITPRYSIQPAQPRHLSELAETMREADRTEIVNLGIPIRKALWRGYRASIMCRVAIVDAKVAALWGLAITSAANVSPLSDVGIPWLHTSVAIEAVPVSFVALARKEVMAMRKLRPRLESYVDASYTRAIKFLRLLGFSVDEPLPAPATGALFRRFHLGFDA